MRKTLFVYGMKSGRAGIADRIVPEEAVAAPIPRPSNGQIHPNAIWSTGP